MVVLEFLPDRRKLREVRCSGTIDGLGPVPEEDALEMPVRLSVNGVELFALEGDTVGIFIAGEAPGDVSPSTVAVPPDPWLTLPILDVAVNGYAQLREALTGGRADYVTAMGGERLIFEAAGDQVRVTSRVANRSASASREEWLSAFDRFRRRVRRLLVRTLPDIEQHPGWGRWFPR